MLDIVLLFFLVSDVLLCSVNFYVLVCNVILNVKLACGLFLVGMFYIKRGSYMSI